MTSKIPNSDEHLEKSQLHLSSKRFPNAVTSLPTSFVDRQKDGDKKDKKAKKEKPAAVKKEVDVSISALDIRIGVITKVAKHPNADT
jgi:tRNA-binding EMAP/Myf-like protein